MALDPEAEALWARVTATVSALAGRRSPPSSKPLSPPPERSAARHAIERQPLRPEPARSALPPSDTLDGGWDRRLRRGLVAPDRMIDLHGHSLPAAHAALDHALERAIGDDARLLLVVTGRAPRADVARPTRGLIRAAIGDWLAASRHAARIAAVRGAHPRHGGAGALYVILRRRR